MIGSAQKLLMARAGVPAAGPEWDITRAVTGSALTVNTSADEQELSFSDDGTKMFNTGIFSTAGRIYAQGWDLSTAWDISTASPMTVANATFDGNGSSFIRSTFAGDGGAKLFWGNDSGIIGSRTATTAWDLSTYTDDANDTTLSGFGAIFGMHWVDSTTFYLTCVATGINDFVAQKFTCSTAWDVTTASSSGSYKRFLNIPRGMFVDATETHMFVVDQNTDTVFRYDMSSAGDLSTASYVSSFDGDGSASSGVKFNPNGLSFFTLRSSSVRQYNIT